MCGSLWNLPAPLARGRRPQPLSIFPLPACSLLLPLAPALPASGARPPVSDDLRPPHHRPQLQRPSSDHLRRPLRVVPSTAPSPARSSHVNLAGATVAAGPHAAGQSSPTPPATSAPPAADHLRASRRRTTSACHRAQPAADHLRAARSRPPALAPAAAARLRRP